MKDREKVAEILRNITSLPTLPDVAMKVLEMSERPDVSMRSIGDIVERDPVIATRLLKLVNSPFYGIRREVTSIHQALLILGLSSLRNLVLSSSMTDLFNSAGSVGSFDRRELWRHSIATAIVARCLASKTRAADSDVAFTAGLIHDVGKIVVDRHFHEEFKVIIQEMDLKQLRMIEAENTILGVNHAEIGCYLAGRWNLPEVLRAAIGFHHNPVEGMNHSRIAGLVAMADQMARELGVGNGGGCNPEVEPEIYELCRLDAELYEAMRAELEGEMEAQVGTLVNMD